MLWAKPSMCGTAEFQYFDKNIKHGGMLSLIDDFKTHPPLHRPLPDSADSRIKRPSVDGYCVNMSPVWDRLYKWIKEQGGQNGALLLTAPWQWSELHMWGEQKHRRWLWQPSVIRTTGQQESDCFFFSKPSDVYYIFYIFHCILEVNRK